MAALHFLVLFANVLYSHNAAADRILRVLSWPGYADPDVVKAFETRFHVKVDLTIVDSDEGLRKKMHEGAVVPFDVLAANTAEIQRYAQENLLAPLDLSQLPNTRHQLARFQARDDIEGLTRDGKLYGIPYTYSSMGLIYDRRQIASPPRTMAALWDPQYRGKVLDYNGASQNFSFVALAMGYHDPFQLDASQIKAVTRKLITLRRNLLAYYTVPEDAVAMFTQHHVALMFGNYGTQQVALLRRAGADVGYVIPDEGALAWLDCWAVTAQAQDKSLAASWINYMLEPGVSGLLKPRQGLADTLTPEASTHSNSRIFWTAPVEDIGQRETLWRKVVSGDRPEQFP